MKFKDYITEKYIMKGSKIQQFSYEEAKSKVKYANKTLGKFGKKYSVAEHPDNKSLRSDKAIYAVEIK